MKGIGLSAVSLFHRACAGGYGSVLCPRHPLPLGGLGLRPLLGGVGTSRTCSHPSSPTFPGWTTLSPFTTTGSTAHQETGRELTWLSTHLLGAGHFYTPHTPIYGRGNSFHALGLASVVKGETRWRPKSSRALSPKGWAHGPPGALKALPPPAESEGVGCK